MKTNKFCLLILFATVIAAETGCVERRVVYVPSYQYPAGYAAQPAATSGQAPVVSPTDTNAPPASAVASQAPPPPQVEVVPVAPGADYYWVPGYWYWRANGWVWWGGRWTIRPWHGAIWVHGGWARGRGGWRWHGGHWR